VVDDLPVDDPGFGTPTPPPGYESRIPVAPIVEEPYPNDGLYGQIDPTRSSAPSTQPSAYDPLVDDTDRGLPGSPGGRGV
jgi:hypothetical protein